MFFITITTFHSVRSASVRRRRFRASAVRNEDSEWRGRAEQDRVRMRRRAPHQRRAIESDPVLVRSRLGLPRAASVLQK